MLAVIDVAAGKIIGGALRLFDAVELAMPVAPEKPEERAPEGALLH